MSKTPFTASAILAAARQLSARVDGAAPKIVPGGHRWSDANHSARFTTYSPDGVKVVCVLSVFRDGTLALDFFSDEGLSGMDKFENIGHQTYQTKRLPEMAKDLKWVWKTVDAYRDSWREDDED